jgi:hypothetical protein
LVVMGGGKKDRAAMLRQASNGKERPMTERDRSPGSGGTEDNVRDEFEEATRHGKPEKDASREAVEEEERSGGTGGVKENVRDEWDESQRR